MACTSALFVVIANFFFFFDLNLKFQPKVCHVCHDMTQKSPSFDDFAINNVERHDCRINFWFITKNEVVDIKKKPIAVTKVDTYDYKKLL